jgi:hypothetical protein
MRTFDGLKNPSNGNPAIPNTPFQRSQSLCCAIYAPFFCLEESLLHRFSFIVSISCKQLTALGIVGEYVGGIYMETKRRPLFIVQEHFGFHTETPMITDKEKAA